ncbi:MAG: hypothetical protein ACC662_09450 [Planctomycetota bacterium]
MTFLLLLPAVLSLLAFCGHLLREGMVVLLPFALLLLPLLLVPRGWVARLWQVALLAFALDWIRTGVFLASGRQASGEPWIRMAAILGAVALLAVGAALLFESRRLLERYQRPPLL